MTHALPAQQASIARIVHGTAPTEVKEVVERLDQLQVVMEEFNDRPKNPVASFNRLYRVITQEVDKRLANDEFQDPKFMKTLTLRFAERYLDALQEWNDNNAVAPRCWSALFNQRNSDDMAPIIGAIAGVTAHIRFDLGVALVQTFKEIEESILAATPAQVADYKVLDQIFTEQIPSLRRGMLDGNPFADLIDKVTGDWDDVVQAATVAEAREDSWEQAEELWPLWERPDRYAAAIRSMDERTEAEIKMLFLTLDNPIGNYFLGSGLFWGSED